MSIGHHGSILRKPTLIIPCTHGVLAKEKQRTLPILVYGVILCVFILTQHKFLSLAYFVNRLTAGNPAVF